MHALCICPTDLSQEMYPLHLKKLELSIEHLSCVLSWYGTPKECSTTGNGLHIYLLWMGVNKITHHSVMSWSWIRVPAILMNDNGLVTRVSTGHLWGIVELTGAKWAVHLHYYWVGFFFFFNSVAGTFFGNEGTFQEESTHLLDPKTMIFHEIFAHAKVLTEYLQNQMACWANLLSHASGQ